MFSTVNVEEWFFYGMIVQTVNNGEMGRIDIFDFDGQYVTWTTDGVNAGCVFYRDGKFNCTNVCGTIRPFEDDAHYLALALAPLTRRHVSTNLANPKLMNGVMKAIEVPLPPLPEQRRIAAALGDMDKLIENLGKRIAKKRLIKKGAMQELLTGKKRLPGFGRAVSTKPPMSFGGALGDRALPPPDWKRVKIGDVAEFRGRIGFRGYTKQDLVRPLEGAISLSPSNMINGYVDWRDCTYISWQKYEESPEIKIELGDVLLVKTASVGRSAYVDSLPWPATLNPQVAVFKNIKMHHSFFAYLIGDKIVQDQITSVVVGSTIPTLSQQKVMEFILPCPELAEQAAIARVLSDMDAEIASLERRQAKLKLIKKGMLQDLLTGKVRI